LVSYLDGLHEVLGSDVLICGSKGGIKLRTFPACMKARTFIIVKNAIILDSDDENGKEEI